jgi:hypothetical protein
VEPVQFPLVRLKSQFCYLKTTCLCWVEPRFVWLQICLTGTLYIHLSVWGSDTQPEFQRVVLTFPIVQWAQKNVANPPYVWQLGGKSSNQKSTR